MTAQAYEPVHIRTTGNHVEVDGLSQADVEAAINLYRSVVKHQLDARAGLASQLNTALTERGLSLISDASQRQVIQNVAIREKLLEEEGFETYATLAALRNSTEKATRTWVSRQRERSELFTVEIQGRTLIPKVQLSASGKVNPRVAELTRALGDAGLGGWDLWAWLTSPTGRLSGEIPAEVVRTNMARAHRAALRYANELRLAQGGVA